MDLRKAIQLQREHLSNEQVQEKSAAIIERLCQSDLLQGTRIAVYAAVNHEVKTEALIQWLWTHPPYQCFLPCINIASETLSFAAYTPDTNLKWNAFKIEEPSRPSCEFFGPDMDTVIVPLVGFNPACQRLGRGGGYYDRTFAFLNKKPRKKRPILIGLAYDFQCIPHWLGEKHDVPVDAIITESQVYSAHRD